jgi:hypothetical protein
VVNFSNESMVHSAVAVYRVAHNVCTLHDDITSLPRHESARLMPRTADWSRASASVALREIAWLNIRASRLCISNERIVLHANMAMNEKGKPRSKQKIAKIWRVAVTIQKPNVNS